MAFHPIIGRVSRLSVASLAVFVASSVGAMAACSDAPANYVDWRGCDLSRAILSNSELIDADLRGANLSGANLSGADLTGANLMGANLFRANLTNANLFDANLNDARLSVADMRNATWSDGRTCAEGSIGSCR